MKNTLRQILIIACIVLILLLCYLFRSSLGLSDEESIAGVILILSTAIIYITLNLIAEKIFKPGKGKSTLPISIACAVVSAGIIMLFHDQITRCWEALFKLL